MSLAKINRVTKARKDQGACEHCGTEIKAGDPYIWFTVGFRSSIKHVRCTVTDCIPKPSERESSMLSSVYDAQEQFNIDDCTSVEDIQEQLNDFAAVVEEVAEQYREAGTNDNGVEFNPDSIERADILDEAASELQGWEVYEDFPGCSEHTDLEQIDTCQDCKVAYESWWVDVTSSAQQLVDEVELP